MGKEHMMEQAKHVRLNLAGFGKETIEIEGVDIARYVRGFTLEGSAGRPAVLILDLSPGKVEVESVAKVLKEIDSVAKEQIEKLEAEVVRLRDGGGIEKFGRDRL